MVTPVTRGTAAGNCEARLEISVASIYFAMSLCCVSLSGFDLYKDLGIFGDSFSMWLSIDPHLLLFTMLPTLLAGACGPAKRLRACGRLQPTPKFSTQRGTPCSDTCVGPCVGAEARRAV